MSALSIFALRVVCIKHTMGDKGVMENSCLVTGLDFRNRPTHSNEVSSSIQCAFVYFPVVIRSRQQPRIHSVE
jgi:hypothetical protein